MKTLNKQDTLKGNLAAMALFAILALIFLAVWWVPLFWIFAGVSIYHFSQWVKVRRT